MQLGLLDLITSCKFKLKTLIHFDLDGTQTPQDQHGGYISAIKKISN